MLLIAIPKSASTSIMSTFGELHAVSALQDIEPYRSLDKPDEVNYLYNLHGDIREFSEDIVSRWSDSNTFYKQHVFPSDNNLALLKDLKKVVLLRDPKEVILGYHRGVEKGIHKMYPGFKYGMSSEKWFDKATEMGLYDDLKKFYNSWEENNDQNTLIIYFDDLMSSKKTVINKIEAFYDLRQTEEKFELHTKRYSSRKITLKRKLRLWLKKKYVNTMIFFNLPY